MSVTFSVCKENLVMQNDKVMVSYTILYPPTFDKTPVVDPEYPEYGAISPENPWDLNVNNYNAREILQSLGVELTEDLCGIIDPTKLLDTCNNNLATINVLPNLDGGTESEESVGKNGCTFINCGRSVGYFNHRFNKLKELVLIAIQNDAIITFG